MTFNAVRRLDPSKRAAMADTGIECFGRKCLVRCRGAISEMLIATDRCGAIGIFLFGVAVTTSGEIGKLQPPDLARLRPKPQRCTG